jgi:hypothetical protein
MMTFEIPFHGQDGLFIHELHELALMRLMNDQLNNLKKFVSIPAGRTGVKFVEIFIMYLNKISVLKRIKRME